MKQKTNVAILAYYTGIIAGIMIAIVGRALIKLLDKYLF